MEPRRALNRYELEVLAHALAKAKAQVDPSILDSASVEDIAATDKDWHHIRLHYADAPWLGGGYTIIADWLAADLDGRPIALLVLGNETGRPYEMEICRLDLQPIQHLPGPKSWRDRPKSEDQSLR